MTKIKICAMSKSALTGLIALPQSSYNPQKRLKNNDYKKQEFARFIKIDEPSSEDNYIKVKSAIKKTYQKLLDLNIHHYSPPVLHHFLLLLLYLV